MEEQLVKALVIIGVYVVVIAAEAALFEERWKEHENARFTMGSITVFLASLIGVYVGVLDGIPEPWNLYLELVCVFGLFGVGLLIKGSFGTDRSAKLNDGDLGLEGGGDGDGTHSPHAS
jgi:Mn2+/Fe2+ NRAMP family transporter